MEVFEMNENQECQKVFDEKKGNDATETSLLNKDIIQRKQLLYAVDENPGYALNIILGFQQYFTMVGGSIVLPFVLASAMCFSSQQLVISELMSTLSFILGISTILQVTLGVRLPIIQGGSFAFVGSTRAILNLPEYQCSGPGNQIINENLTGIWNTSLGINITQTPNTEYVQDDWKFRMNLICGSLMVASTFQVFIGFSGMIGILLKFIGPLTTSTIITLVGLHLYPIAVKNAGTNWIISSVTVLLVLVFTLYMAEVPVPVPGYTRKKGYKTIWFKPFKLFPIIIAILVSWAICGILTAANVFSDDPKDPSFVSRTDARIGVVREAKWIRVPYPGQWGMPTVTVAAVFGTCAGVISSIIESVGDYYACAGLSGAPPPPKHAINRGIGIEGICCIISGALGGGNGVTSFSENIAAIGITRVGSRSVILCAGILMIFFGMVGKFGAILSTIPTPVVGGVFVVLFGLITSVGISNLQFVNLNSTRNLTVFGCSVMLGMGLPYWIKANNQIINTGNRTFDQVITVLLTTEIFVGGLISAILDNTAPGTIEERGMLRIQKLADGETLDECASVHCYDFPLPLQTLLNKTNVTKYFPFLPHYNYRKSVLTEEC